MNPRALAATTLYEVIYEHHSLTQILSKTFSSLSNPKDRGLIQEICFGTLRFYHQLQFITHKLLQKPIKEKEGIVNCLLMLGLYQLIYMRIPEYAAVSETIDAAKLLKKNWATGLLNKTLRRFTQNRENFFMVANQELESRYSHPAWLIHKLQNEWPDHWEDILAANNSKPPLWLRVNCSQISRDNFLKLLEENNISAVAAPELEQAIIIPQALPVEKIPGFKEGLFCVQDGAAQKVVDFLDLEPGQKILDACAAPGVKTSHILEVNPKLGLLIAIDKDAARLTKIKENIDRLRLSHQKVHLKLEDASHVKQWWDGTLFDRILLDAPCSSTGVIRRHPDIKLLKTPGDIENLVQQQQHLLNSLWQTLAPKGKLIYTTCSIIPDENEKVISNFLHSHKDAKTKRPPFNWGMKLQYGFQRLPEKEGMDGFYYCVLVKN